MSIRRFWSKLLCSSVALFVGASAAQAQVGTIGFEFANPGVCVNPGASSSSAANVTLKQICRGAGVGFTSNNNGFNSNNWVTSSESAAVAADDYVSFGIDITAGFESTITDLGFRLQRSSTGPTTIAIRSSVDGFTSTLATISTIPSSAPSNPTNFDIADVTACGMIEFRVYGWGASSANGTLRFQGPDNAIVMQGSVQAQVNCGGGGDPTGACCFANGDCNVQTSANCTTAGGTYQGDDVTCVEANCPVPTGSCCVGAFCQVTTAAECAAFSGIFNVSDPNCSVQCVEPTGACCLQDGMCTILTATNCGLGGGVYAGDATTCDGRACTFACCFANGTCQLLSVNACNTAGGTPDTTRTVCSACPQPAAIGACCVGTACTADLTWTECQALTGIWMGRGVACSPTICEQASSPTLVAKYDFDVNQQGMLTVTTIGTPPFPLGDAFGFAQAFRLDPEPEPFALVDQSTSVFPTDEQGFLGVNKVDSVFGVVDTHDVIAADPNEATAVWEFDVTGRTNLSMTIDIAGMGNFEVAGVEDRFILEVAIDANPYTVIFDGRADEAASANYTMDSGAVVSVDDPLRDQVSGILLDNNFATFTYPIAGTGSTLRLRLRASTDGGSDEAFAIDNIMVMADAIVGTPEGACCSGNGCQITTEDLCVNTLGGAYEGDDTVCNPDPCASAPCPGDYNGDDAVDLADLIAFNTEWQPNIGTTQPAGTNGDYNGDTMVDLADLIAFNTDWQPNIGVPCP